MRERFFSVPEVPIFQVQSECEYGLLEENCTFLVECDDPILVVASTPAADDAVR